MVDQKTNVRINFNKRKKTAAFCLTPTNTSGIHCIQKKSHWQRRKIVTIDLHWKYRCHIVKSFAIVQIAADNLKFNPNHYRKKSLNWVKIDIALNCSAAAESVNKKKKKRKKAGIDDSLSTSIAAYIDTTLKNYSSFALRSESELYSIAFENRLRLKLILKKNPIGTESDCVIVNHLMKYRLYFNK